MAALLTASAAGAHGLISLGLVVPADCAGGEPCLRTVEHQPRLHAGETVDLNLYNDDHDEVHEILVTTNASADHEGRNTSPEHALNTPVAMPPNSSVSAYELQIPSDAEALYAWCSVDDHEAEGEHLVVPLAPPHAETDDVIAPASATLGVLLALVVAAGWLRWRP